MSTCQTDFDDLIDRQIPGLDEERKACEAIAPQGFHLRPPPAPHLLSDFITLDSGLFETIHMGAAVVNQLQWQLVVDGLVRRPFVCSFDQLKRFPSTTITAFHECYGSPLKPPVSAVWRIGNVKWTGVSLKTLLEIAEPLDEAYYVWSDGLDHGSFAGRSMDRYQKDLPIAKALSPEVLIVYELNGQPLRKERGGPVRLIVPGFFGTNSTKWVCRISLRAHRSPSPFTTLWYNEQDPFLPQGKKRPVWRVEPNSIIVHPRPDSIVHASETNVKGWAWSHDGIEDVSLSLDGGTTWTKAVVADRTDFSWQAFTAQLAVPRGSNALVASATSVSGVSQPMQGRRNHVHKVVFTAV